MFIESAPQFYRFTKAFKEGFIWVHPKEIKYMETNEKIEKGEKEPIKFTIIHLKGDKTDKLFIREHPDEVNKILRETKHAITYKG